MPIASTDHKIYLSGGTSNALNVNSLGGAKSSVALSGNLFADITYAQAVAGRTVYRCVYVGNAHATITADDVRAWLSVNTPGTATNIDIGVGAAAVNGTETAIASETVAPDGVTFGPAATGDAAVMLGDMAPGQFRALWLRLTVNAGAAADADEPFNLRIESESAGAASGPTAVTMSGPTSGTVGVASSAFTVGTDGTRSASVTVTPTPVAGVTFNPASVTLPAGTGSATFTATSSSSGAKTIAVTNNGGLTNPASITLNVAAAATAPSAPTAVTATAGNASASVTGTAPASNGGAAITGYRATSSPGGITATSSTLPVNVTGLTNGTAYTFTLAAQNSVGYGPESAASASVTPVAPASGLYDTFVTTNHVTASGSDPTAYTGNGNATSENSNGGGIWNKKFAANTDGWVTMEADANSMSILGVASTAATNMPARSYCTYGIANLFGSSTNYSPQKGNSAPVPYTGTDVGGSLLKPAAGDIIKIERTNSAGGGNTATLTLSVARAATPTNFVTQFTAPNISAGELAVHWYIQGTPSVTKMRSSGLVAR